MRYIKQMTICCLLALAVLLCQPINLKAQGIIYVNIDEAKILRIKKRAHSVIIGNTAIADVSAYDDQTLLLTGVSYGLTNMIIIDEDGNEIFNTDISVKQRDIGAVTIYRADEKSNVRCLPRCEPELAISGSSTSQGSGEVSSSDSK